MLFRSGRDFSILHANKTVRSYFAREGRRGRDLEFSDLPQVLGSKIYQVLKTGTGVAPFKYSPPDSPMAIRVRANGNAVFVDVTDHGAGISPEDENRIFERFYRGRSVRNQIPGSGLGLNIASSIMQAHHGDLTVVSQSDETTFRMILPVNQTRGASS